ncbi:MAG: hypothetical protein WKG01_04060 [Kofleriaceae bacterium]
MWRALVLLAGCGRFGFEPRPDDVLDRCAAEHEELGSWSPPRLLAAVNDPTTGDDDPVITADGRELFFTSARTGTLGQSDIWRSRRSDPSAPWEMPTHVPELSTASNENTLELSTDGLTMWFASDRPGTLGNEDLWFATRPDRESPWRQVTNEAELNTASLERGPSLFLEGRALLFHTGRTGGPGKQDLWIAQRDEVGAPWQPAAPLAAPNTSGDELRGWASPCGLELYFQASRGATMDFYLVRRGSLDEPFGPERRIDELSDAIEYDQDLRLSGDRRHAVFSSGRSGRGDLYESSR